MKRRFSCREISLIDQMIQTIGRDLFLPERLGDDARSIGWCTFRRLGTRLSGYPDRAACLSGTGDLEILHAISRSAAYHREQGPAAERFSCEARRFSLVYLPAGLYAAAAGG